MPKPKFDPSQPFEPVQEQKPAFDPTQPFEPVADPIQFQPGHSEALKNLVSNTIKSPAARKQISGIEEQLYTPSGINQYAASALFAPGVGASKYLSSKPAMETALGAKNALGRVLLGAGAGGAIDVAHAPDATPLEKLAHFGRGAAIGGALGTGTQLLSNAIPYAGTIIGAKLAHVPTEEALNYARNPQLAEELQSTAVKNPGALDQSLTDQIKEALSKIYKEKVSPLVQKRGEALVGTQATMDTAPFKGTAAEQELQRMLNAKNPRELGSTLTYGEPIEQSIPISPVTPQRADFSAIPKSYVKTPSKLHGAVEEALDSTHDANIKRANAAGFNPYDSEIKIPVSEVARGATPAPNAQMPSKIALTGAQIQRLKKIAADAADFRRKQMGFIAQNDADAIVASNTKKALEGIAPKVEDLNAEIQRHAMSAEDARRFYGNNPTRILGASETPGSAPNRVLREYLDQNAGANFQEQAEALAAGKALNKPSVFHGSKSVAGKFVTEPVGKMMIKGSGAIKNWGGSNLVQDPRTLETLLGIQNSAMPIQPNPWMNLPQTNKETR